MTSQTAVSTSQPTLPPVAVLYQLAIGHYVSRALHVAARLRIADHLAQGPLDAQELAKAAGAHAQALRRVMRLLASAGVFEELEDGRFAASPLGELLREDVPGSARALVMLFAGWAQESWRELEFCVRTGEPGFRRTDPDLDWFAAMARDPEAASLFDDAMATFAPQTAVAVAMAYDFSGIRTLVDVGGGNGALLIHLLKANPDLRGLVFDMPHVAASATAAIEREGIGDRCTAVGGSFFESIPRGGDAYMLKHVIHDWNDAQAIQILEKVRAVIPSGGRLLLVEGVYPQRIDTAPASRAAAANDVNMLVVTGGRQRSENEFRELYAAAGFRVSRTIPTLSPAASVIEGTPV